MKKIVILLFIIAIIFSSCTNTLDEISNKIWKGELILVDNKKVLSDIIVKISNDTMFVYSNAIFGSKRDTLIITDNKNDTLFLKNNDENIKLKYSQIKNENSVKLLFEGNGFVFEMSGIETSDINNNLISFYNNYVVPVNSYMYLDNTYKGFVKKDKGNKELSEVKFKIKSDTLFIFANAIFGANNDTLFLKEFNESDTAFKYTNNNNEEFELKLSKDNLSNNYLLIGTDFIIEYNVYNNDIFLSEELKFYNNQIVPRFSYMYLDGAYEGEAELEDPMSALFMGSSFGNYHIKLVFIDNNEVKLFQSLGIFTDKPQIVKYIYEGDYVKLQTKALKFNKYRISDFGRKLVFQDNVSNAILYKIY